MLFEKLYKIIHVKDSAFRRKIVDSLGFGLFNLIIRAFISDIIDDREVKTGVREDGTIYAVCSFR